MKSRDPYVTLRQIQEAARYAQAICNGTTFQDFVEDWQARAALERFIEIMGEAVKRLPEDFRTRYPDVPWREIAGTRDRLIHGYDDVDHRVLWEAVKTDIPAILLIVDAILKD